MKILAFIIFILFSFDATAKEFIVFEKKYLNFTYSKCKIHGNAEILISNNSNDTIYLVSIYYFDHFVEYRNFNRSKKQNINLSPIDLSEISSVSQKVEFRKIGQIEKEGRENLIDCDTFKNNFHPIMSSSFYKKSKMEIIKIWGIPILPHTQRNVNFYSSNNSFEFNPKKKISLSIYYFQNEILRITTIR